MTTSIASFIKRYIPDIERGKKHYRVEEGLIVTTGKELLSIEYEDLRNKIISKSKKRFLDAIKDEKTYMVLVKKGKPGSRTGYILASLMTLSYSVPLVYISELATPIVDIDRVMEGFAERSVEEVIERVEKNLRL